MVLAGTVSCHRTSEAEARLIAIDSLIPVNPDSALTLLEAIEPRAAAPKGADAGGSPDKRKSHADIADHIDRLPPTGLMTRSERAYYALLTVQALYKAYIPATSDSLINIAWDYYKDHGPYDRRIRAMLYKGTTAEELGHLDTAMYWYKRTELESRPDDHYHRSYALMNMGSLYQRSYSFKHAINKYRQVLIDSGLVETETRKFCVLQLSQLYNINNLDSSIYYLNVLKKLVDTSSGDSYYEHGYREGLVFYHYYKNEYDKVKEIGLNTIELDSNIVSCACWQAISIAYAKLGGLDSAEFFHNHSPKLANLDDSVFYNQAISEIRLLAGDFVNSVKYENESDEIASRKVISSIDNNLTTIESNTYKEWRESLHNHDINKMSSSVALFALIVFLLLFGLNWHKSKRKRYELQSLQQFIGELESKAYAGKQLENDYRITKEQLDSQNAEIESMRQSMDSFTDTLRVLLNSLQKPHKKSLKSDSDIIIRNVLSEPFFALLRQYVDNAHHGLATAMSNNDQVSDQDINIICMHICKIPNSIIGNYAGYTSVHSVTTRKEKIVKAFLGENAKISDIMNY